MGRTKGGSKINRVDSPVKARTSRTSKAGLADSSILRTIGIVSANRTSRLARIANRAKANGIAKVAASKISRAAKAVNQMMQLETEIDVRTEI